MAGENEKGNIDSIQGLYNLQQQTLFMNQLEIPQLNMPQFHNQFSPNNSCLENGTTKRVGIPPSHPPISPYSQISATNNQIGSTHHNLSLPQPAFFFPTTTTMSDLSFEEKEACSSSPFASLPPRRGHKRSNSDIPFGFSQPSLSHMQPMRSPGALPVQLVKKETSWDRKNEAEVVDDLFSAYMNLDNIDAFNSEDIDSRASGTKTNGGESSDNEATSSVNESGGGSSKRVETTSSSRHYRSVSMDSFMGKMDFSDEKMAPGLRPGQLSPSNSIDSNSNFSLEFGNGEFSGAEMKKIMANDKLAEIASNDPKRAKRILANRQSAARSKERKMRYITELEHKVQTLQTEATTLSAQLTLLQRDSAGLTRQNNELKFRLQAMEQQAQLRDALNEALNGEVQCLKLETVELNGGDTSKFQHLSINPRDMYRLRQQQANCNTSAKHEPEK